MQPIRPFEIRVVNRITGHEMGRYYANQVPGQGDLLSFYPQYAETDPFRRWGVWRVDGVLWTLASPASPLAFELARESGGDKASAYCASVDIHVWPAQGLHWTKTPEFVKALYPEEDYE